MSHRFTAVVALALLAVSGCSAGTPSPSGTTADESNGAAASATAEPATLTRETLPMEVGTTWSTVSLPEGEVASLDLTVEGPWNLTAAPEWDKETHEIVDPGAVPGVEDFADVTFVTRLDADGQVHYYPRTVSEDWVDHLGRIVVDGESVSSEPLATPQHFWPLNLEVGRTYDVGTNESFAIEAEVLSRGTATVPAGTVENTYLVRFVYTPLAEEDDTWTYYYMFAPHVGVVALLKPSRGSEADGFTEFDSVDLLASLPTG